MRATNVPNQIDYIIFSAAIGLILVGLAYVLKSRHGVMLHPVWWGLCVVTLFAGGWATAQSGVKISRQQEESMIIMARTYALELERLGHEKVTLETKEDDPTYLTICKALSDWRIANPIASDIYTMRKVSPDNIVVIADPPTDYDGDGRFSGEREERTPIGEIFNEHDAGLERALAGEACFNAEIIEDRWGSWVGSWAPIRNSSGKIEAAVGVDYPSSLWYKAIAAARRDTMIGTAFFLAIIAIGGAAFSLLRTDMSKRAEVEARFRDTDERMQLTIRQMPIGFIEWNVNAKVLAWNPRAEKIFGFSNGEAVGRSMFDEIVAPAARVHVDQIFEDLLVNRGGTHSINENLTKSGQIITCEWFNTPLVDEHGKVVSVFSLMQDITDRIHLEKHVQQSQRLNAVGQLAAGVAHDFNNILTIVTGHTGLLLSRDDIPSDARADLERIEDAALRAASLTRQLLTFSRQQAIFPRPLRINEVVQISAELLQRVIGEHIHFNVRLAEGLPTVEADPAMLDQVITNLAINARDAMPRGGSLTIATELIEVTAEAARENSEARPGPTVQISVTDTGSGIRHDNLPRIFEPFFTTKEVGKGTGLGLAVVHGIVRQHRGWISVESVLAKGTTFRVHLPTSEKPPESVRTARTQSAKIEAPKLQTILIVEDEAVVRELAKIILERAGYCVLEAEDGPTALSIWSQLKDEIDMLITDMVMPNGITGRELAQRLSAERPELPIIYASGYSQELTAPNFEETARRVFLQKPYSPDQLTNLVKKLLLN